MIRKYLLFSWAALLISLGMSCEKENVSPQLTDLHGQWNLTNLEINGQAAANFGPFSARCLLGLQETGSFYLDYNSGTWELKGNELRLWARESDRVFRDYTIIYSSADSLVLGAFLTERDFYADFPQFDSNARLVTVSHFSR